LPKAVDVLFRPATPPEHPLIKWRGFAPGTTLLKSGTSAVAGARQLDCDIRVDRDVEVQLRDGTRIFVDVYRPVTDEPVPAILAWSPYGKQGSFQDYDIFPGRAGVSRETTSGLPKSDWEGPDPAFWCAHDYAVVNVDPRGCFESQGDIQFFSALEARDGYDVVEWAGTQEWCSGKVTFSGNSYLAVSQWLIASTHPPHLACIAPWEGLNDSYRDVILRGGIHTPAVPEIITMMNGGRGQIEDLPSMARLYPFMNEYWQSKIIDTRGIDVPAYVVASWTNAIHTRGTLAAYTGLDPSKSWLRIHNTQEWPDLYEYEEDLLKFFDFVIKGKDNGWAETPRVRLSILDPGGQDQVNRAETAYPLERVREVALHLDAGGQSLSTSAPAAESSVQYDPGTANVIFRYKIERDVELIGPMKLRVWLETVGFSFDADLFVYVGKADADGNPLTSFIPPGDPWPGAHGRLRATHRELDEQHSTPLSPVHRHERPLPVEPGTPIALDIPIWPVGMAWHPGEELTVLIGGKNLTAFSPIDALNVNSGPHKILTGGQYDSHLLVPLATPDGI